MEWRGKRRGKCLGYLREGPGVGGCLGIGPQNEVSANGLCYSLPSPHHLLFYVSSPGTFSKGFERRSKGPENRSGSSSQPFTLSSELASRCCEPQERNRLLSDNDLLCVWHIVVYILVDVQPCDRDSYKIKYSIEFHHVPTSMITRSTMLKGSKK